MVETYTAYVDRITDTGDAVLLLEEDGETVAELRVDVTELPRDSRHERAVLKVKLQNGALAESENLPAEEAQRRDRIREKMERTAVSLDDLDREDIR